MNNLQADQNIKFLLCLILCYSRCAAFSPYSGAPSCRSKSQKTVYFRLSCTSHDYLKEPKPTSGEHKAEIKFVDWAGSKGLLPIQSYSNCLEIEAFEGWLRKPFPKSKSIGHNAERESFPLHDEASTGSNKAYAENKASRALDPNIHLAPIYIDSHIICVNKPSGVLSVPGPRRNPSVATLVHEYFGNEEDEIDCMVVHRLDMDTSGLILYARNKEALATLHDAFRAKSQMGEEEESVYKKYEALVCGHLTTHEGEIDLPLGRDKLHPPFMKVIVNPDDDNVESETFGRKDEGIKLRKHKGYMKMMSKAPKDSLTIFRVLSLEYLDGLPTTRLELVPVTGRTHQLRVACAAIGHPILGDTIYGIHGDGCLNGGLNEDQMSLYPDRASESLQKDLYKIVEERKQNKRQDEYNGDLYLHAKQLNIHHPLTSAPISFHADAPF